MGDYVIYIFENSRVIYTLDASAGHQFSDLQFGFVPGGGINLATALVNDINSYCTK